jgi:lysophospholipase L1-like esterase
LNARLAVAALAVGSLALAACLAEGAVRLYAALGYRVGREIAAVDPTQVLIEAHGEFGFRPRPGSVVRYGRGKAATINSMGFRGPTVERRKPAGTLRIILLGGSTTHGWGVNDDETIDAAMRTWLAVAFPERRWEVVNLAFDGYDSWQLFERLRSDGLPLQPDAIIINGGINDVRSMRYADIQDHDPRTLLYAATVAQLRDEQRRGGPTLWTRVKSISYLARLPGVLRDLRARPPQRAAGAAPSPHFASADYFERNLRRIADLTAPAGTVLIFSTEPSALVTGRYRTTDTSYRDYWIGDAATTQAARDTLASRMRRVATGLRGRAVAWIGCTLPQAVFLDDAHLTPRGNALLAVDLAQLSASLLLPDRLAAPPRVASDTGSVCMVDVTPRSRGPHR